MHEPSGIGGWLILPMLGLIIGPIMNIKLLSDSFVPLFESGTWDIVKSALGSYTWIIIFEVIMNSLFIIFSIALLVLLLLKHPKFPKLIIILYVSNIAFIILDAIFASSIPSMGGTVSSSSLTSILRTIATSAIWIPYFLMSKRVENTFVEKESEMTSLITEQEQL